jgi:hypothetical protein
MKDILFEFYKPEDAQLKKAWDSGIFTFDANVLLNLYRYSDKTTNELMSTLSYLKDKIWLTNQAAYEYLNNRLAVIHKQKVAYDEVKSILLKKFDEISNELNGYKKHSTIEIDEIKESIKKSLDRVSNEIDKLSKTHPNYEQIDRIKDSLTNLFNNKTGDPFSKSQLTELFKEAQNRYDNEIPPGFKDRNSKKDSPKQSLYGDVILWKQIIDKAKKDNKAIILVTDDLKDDWWEKFKGETLGPRKELLREFFDETGQRIYIYQADKFLEYANKLKIGKIIKQDAIKEIRDIRLKDELQLRESNIEYDSIFRYASDYSKYLRSDELKNRLEQLASQQQLFKIESENIKRIQDYLSQKQSKQFGLNYRDLFDNINGSFDTDRKTLKRIAELLSAKRDQENDVENLQNDIESGNGNN